MSGTEIARYGAFISYARQDGEAIARSLQARLASDAPDIPAWLDRLELEGGIGWWKQIEQPARRCPIPARPGILLSKYPAKSAKRLLWAKPDDTIELWDLERAASLATLRGHSEKVNAVAFSHHGQYVMSCSRDRTARAWDAVTGQQLAAYTADSALRSIALSPCDDAVAVGDVAGRVHLLRFEGRERRRS